MSTASESLDSPKLGLKEELDSSTSDDQTDWRVKACELLESHIETLKQSNAELAMKSAAIACSLVELLGDLSSPSHSKNPADPENKDWLVKELSRFVERPPVNLGESSDDYRFPGNHSANQSETPDIELSKSSSMGPATKRAKTEVVQRHKQRKNQHEPKVDLTLKRELSIDFDESEDDDEKSLEDEMMMDAAVVRAAFRLFAKYIGPSLKREYRTEFGCPPTQSWLANQLLARWDSLSPFERRTYHKRVCSLPSTSAL